MAVRGTNTMQEALQSLLQETAQMKTLADADLPWLVELESMVLSKIREPLDAMQSPQQPQSAGPMGGMPPGGPGGPGGMGMPAGGGVPGGGGMQAGPQMPNPDELQRLLAAGGQ